LIALHLFSDLIIGVSYVAISLTLLYLARRAKRNIPFHWMFIAFGTFIIACGATHFMEVWTLWTPVYWLSGAVKLVTAAASATTAFVLPPLIPKSLAMLKAAELSNEQARNLEVANATLAKEAAVRKSAEEEIRRLNTELEERIQQRTSELARTAESLRGLAAVVESSFDAIIGRDTAGAVTSWNRAAERMFGYTAAEIRGADYLTTVVPPETHAEFRDVRRRMDLGEQIPPFETVRFRKDGTRFPVFLTISPIRDSTGQIRGTSTIARDITERKQMDARFQQTQKLESLGLLAGGVAHDFNNLLLGIMGNTSFALETVPFASPHRVLLEDVLKASERAAGLTRQLLAYAGKGRFVMLKISLSDLVTEISGLIRTSIPKQVQLRLELSPNLPVIEADPSQIQQVIMNLIINGAEAIGEGNVGTVLVTTELQVVDEHYISQDSASDPSELGTYVALQVHDTGIGMTDEVRAKLFDPFFSTKFMGRGLGLAAVLGIVRSHKGTIRVYSSPGKGSTFKVLLPAAEGNVTYVESQVQDVRGEGTILVVDDEEIVRSMAKRVLERHGYTVLLAEDGKTGVKMLGDRKNEILIVLLDMTMPVMSGEEAFRHMRMISPRVRVILSSGYNEVEAIRRFTNKGLAGFIQKPYTAGELALKVKTALSAERA
jgi:PAS domain S-box-containing protein